jgi:hypothetical protein
MKYSSEESFSGLSEGKSLRSLRAQRFIFLSFPAGAENLLISPSMEKRDEG